jgi:tRNA threonylcarbamoyladenosine biosynthesis protein TsaB
MARLAAPRFFAGQGTDPADAHPLYIRNKVALKSHER